MEECLLGVTEMLRYLILLAVTLARVFVFSCHSHLTAALNLEAIKYFLHNQPKDTQARLQI